MEELKIGMLVRIREFLDTDFGGAENVDRVFIGTVKDITPECVVLTKAFEVLKNASSFHTKSGDLAIQKSRIITAERLAARTVEITCPKDDRTESEPAGGKSQIESTTPPEPPTPEEFSKMQEYWFGEGIRVGRSWVHADAILRGQVTVGIDPEVGGPRYVGNVFDYNPHTKTLNIFDDGVHVVVNQGRKVTVTNDRPIPTPTEADKIRVAAFKEGYAAGGKEGDKKGYQRGHRDGFVAVGKETLDLIARETVDGIATKVVEAIKAKQSTEFKPTRSPYHPRKLKK